MTETEKPGDPGAPDAPAPSGLKAAIEAELKSSPNEAPEGSDQSPESVDAAAEGSGVIGFVLFPLMIVIVLAGIVWLVQALALDDRTQADYIRQLKSPDRSVRWQAALDLVDTNKGSTDLVPLLIEMLDSSPEENVLAQSTWGSMRDMLSTPEEKELNLRWYLTAALSRIGGERAYDKLLELATDTDRGVRTYAVLGLATVDAGLRAHDDSEARAILIDRLRADEDWGVRASAAFALGSFGATIGDQAEADRRTDSENLIGILTVAHGGDENIDVRRNAAVSLARLGSPAGRETLDSMIRDETAHIRSQGRRALRLLDGTDPHVDASD